MTKVDLVDGQRTNRDLGELVNGQPLYLETPAGTFAVQERPDGAVGITCKDGTLVIHPRLANAIDLTITQ